jgi:hypothetical protein
MVISFIREAGAVIAGRTGRQPADDALAGI